MDGNGIDDIIFGTDSDNLHVLLDGGVSAPGFPIDLGDRIQSEPAIYDSGSEKVILTGCKNNNFYAVNYSDASLRFVLPTADDIFTSPSFDSNNIYFGSDDGNVYGIDIDGNLLSGFPLNIGSSVLGSVVFHDLDGDGISNMVFGTDSGELLLMFKFVLLDNFLSITDTYFKLSSNI